MASQVFPLENVHRRVIRTPVNPMDKSTIISIYPRSVDEVKHTIQPGRFHIDAGTYENPTLLVVTSSSWWKELDPDQPMLEIPVGSVQIADSVVRDYANGLFCCNMGDAMPGLFYLPGEFTIEKIRADHAPLLLEAKIKQGTWYAALVKAADVLWARSNGNPLSISEDMKLAAQELQLKDKPWLRDFTTMQLENCPACGELYDAKFPICKSCHTIINKEMYDELGLTAAPKV